MALLILALTISIAQASNKARNNDSNDTLVNEVLKMHDFLLEKTNFGAGFGCDLICDDLGAPNAGVETCRVSNFGGLCKYLTT